MKNGIKIIVSLSIIFLLLSCNKRRQVDIEGRVYNPVTQEGIAGAELWLLKSGPITEFYGGYERVETVYSDANGNFKVNVKSAKAEILRLGDMHGEYYNIGWYKNGSKLPSDLPVEQGKNMKADFYAVPYGSSKANIVNINCQGVTDTAYFKLKYILSPSLYDYWSLPKTGCYSHSDATSSKRPIGEYIWITKVIRSGNTSYQYDTVSISESGVSIFNINY